MSAPTCIPPVNVKEKIVICVDLTSDEEETPIGLGEHKQEVTTVYRAALAQFIKLKLALKSETEFALVGMLNSKAKWVRDFTCDAQELIETLTTANHRPTKPIEVNMSEYLFPILEENLKPHIPTNVHPSDAPPHVCRVILTYKSSTRVPLINDFKYAMFDSPYVIFDVLYLHHFHSEMNQVDAIYKQLSKLNVSGNSYVIEILNTQIVHIFNSMSILLAHPLQRPPQKDFNSDLRSLLAQEMDDEDDDV